MGCQVAVPPVPPAALCCQVPRTSVIKNSNKHKRSHKPAAAPSLLCVSSTLNWPPAEASTRLFLLSLAVHIAQPPKSMKAQYAALFAMEGDNRWHTQGSESLC